MRTRKKIGYWKQFIDERGNEVDSSNSSFFRLVFFDNGQPVFKYFNGKWKRKLKYSFNGKSTIKGRPEPISGTYKWYDKADRIVSEETYNNGLPFIFKAYYYDDKNSKSCTLKDVIYFDKQFENMKGSYYIEGFDRDDKLKYQCWYRKGKNGWKEFKVE
ncbi:MAG: hypothetical protein A3F72_03275 [Bacteroidetes bacterium RIFCSPLOWO2_12_FULL_35_15]|nr:MAG: hypothetical protein A3F72_03275 [Bacteroidetes bacterium RIFCSPLOWO2_12_FULL_35_15]